MNINGKTKLYGLIGNPIAHSFSPFIHNKLAKICSFDSVYVSFNISSGETQQILSALKFFNISGINVTAPYKNLELKYFYDIDENVRATASVNTILNINGNFYAFNTDVYGIEKTFAKYKINPAGKNVLVFGAGGAAKSVLYALTKKNPATIYIVNRTFENAQRLAIFFSAMFTKIKFIVLKPYEIYDLSKIYLVIQATSEKKSCLPDADTFFKNVDTVFDLAYFPAKTKFLADAQKNACKIINGFDMLIFQAVKSFEIWNDINVDEKTLADLFFYMQRFI